MMLQRDVTRTLAAVAPLYVDDLSDPRIDFESTSRFSTDGPIPVRHFIHSRSNSAYPRGHSRDVCRHD